MAEPINILSFDCSYQKISAQLLSVDAKSLSNEVFRIGSKQNKEILFAFNQEAKSQDLLPTLISQFGEAQLEAKQINLLALSRGPGSFTGIRTSIVVARTLAAELGVPLCAINNFDLFRRDSQPLALTAGKNDYYVSLDCDYQNPETNFYSTDHKNLELINPAEFNIAELILQYIDERYGFDLERMQAAELLWEYNDLVPYYLREPSIK